MLTPMLPPQPPCVFSVHRHLACASTLNHIVCTLNPGISTSEALRRQRIHRRDGTAPAPKIHALDALRPEVVEGLSAGAKQLCDSGRLAAILVRESVWWCGLSVCVA